MCLARPELLDIRSDWGGGRVRATAVELEPLGAADSEVLIEALAEDGAISSTTKRALLDKTGGNPLFLEEVMFKPGREVRVEGKLRGGVFVAKRDSLRTKCPSKYTTKKST